ncbi:MAG: transglutaminase family protein, partial [Prevotella sp.]
IVSMTSYKVAADALPLMLWCLPSRLTHCTDTPADISHSLCRPDFKDAESSGQTLTADFDLAVSIAHEVHGMMEYAPGVTDVGTTAADALAIRRGVCQDYAHIMIALCRRAGMAARYVCGFLCGTGQTHAWVEVFDGYSWRGIDPTNDVCIDYGYIKLAHGRDASDCAVSRGMFGGEARQTMVTDVKVIEI